MSIGRRSALAMNRRTFVAMSGGTLLWPGLWAQGQVTTRRIGFLSASPRVGSERFVGSLRLELEKLGWTDGRNIVLLEPRTAEGKNELLPAMARELVAQSPDLIVVSTLPATRALMEVTKSIPIVMVAVGDPVKWGLIADYRKPRGNVTGSTFVPFELSRKLLQFLKEAVPRLQSVAGFVNPSNEASLMGAKLFQADAAALGMQAQVVEVSGAGDFERAFAVIRSANTQSISIGPEALMRANSGAIADFAQTHRLPLAIVGSSGDSNGLPASTLIAFGPASRQYAQMTARYIDRILKGASPGDLAVEEPTRFELMINLKVAKALGLTIPQAVLQRADVVIQ
jgi:putative tryptophan/tyrosine transport system substrate-binding protein